MSFLFPVPKQPSMPQVAPVMAPAPGSAEAEAERKAAVDKQRQAAALAQGRSSTMISGGMGVTTPAMVRTKALFGE